MARFFYSLPYWDLATAPRTRDEWLAWASSIAKRVAEGFDVETTDGTLEENREGVFRDWENYWGVGHGWVDTYTVKGGEVFLRTPDIGVHTMGGRVCHLLSCLCGARLLPDLVRFGARAAVGYEKEFVIGYIREPEEEYAPLPGEEPTSDADCYTAADCDLEVQRQLLRGASVEDAVKASQSKFEREIGRYETGDRSGWYVAPYMARDLFHDMRAQVLYTAEAAPPPSLSEKYGPGLALAATGVVGMMAIKPKMEEWGVR